MVLSTQYVLSILGDKKGSAIDACSWRSFDLIPYVSFLEVPLILPLTNFTIIVVMISDFFFLYSYF